MCLSGLGKQILTETPFSDDSEFYQVDEADLDRYHWLCDLLEIYIKVYKYICACNMYE